MRTSNFAFPISRSGVMTFWVCLVLSFVVWSCTNLDADNNPAPRRTPPVITMATGTGYISGTTTIERNTPFTIGYRITKGTSNLALRRYSGNLLPGSSAPWNPINESQVLGGVTAYGDTNTYTLGAAGQILFKVYALDQNSLADSTIFTVTVR